MPPPLSLVLCVFKTLHISQQTSNRYCQPDNMNTANVSIKPNERQAHLLSTTIILKCITSGPNSQHFENSHRMLSTSISLWMAQGNHHRPDSESVSA